MSQDSCPSMPNPYLDLSENGNMWHTECSCGYVTPWRATYWLADKDRSRHFEDRRELAIFLASPDLDEFGRSPLSQQEEME